jgi:hypothetical protein
MSSVAAPVVAAEQVSAPVDMSSVLAKIQQLEQDVFKFQQESKGFQGELEHAKKTLAAKEEQCTDLLQDKTAKMKELLRSELEQYVRQLDVKDPVTKDNLVNSLESLATKGNDGAIWEVMACASASHRSNINQLEALQVENNRLKKEQSDLSDGLFGAEKNRQDDTIAGGSPSSRKRKVIEVESYQNEDFIGEMWMDFNTELSRKPIENRACM